jgi:glycogen debranching enzyme
MDTKQLRNSIYETLISLATEEGINASGKDEIYGCIFGRDSAITILKILKVLKQQPTLTENEYDSLRIICRRSLLTISGLQGKETNIQSGEQPGKFIHEFRRSNYEKIIELYGPRVIYPDGCMRNYDSLDATPLGLIAIYRYWEITNDTEFLLQVLPTVERGLNWIITYGDLDKDTILEYDFPVNRTYDGSRVQSWTDSVESILRSDGSMPSYPIAPVEVQGYAWLALKLWADFYSSDVYIAKTQKFAKKLFEHAKTLKETFNKLFVYQDENGFSFAAQALDGEKNQITTVTGNPLLLLWATYQKDGIVESILDERYVASFVERVFQNDLFDKDAGVRTMSTTSSTFNPNQDSYHNGSFWPKLNGMIHEGLLYWHFWEKAALLKEATLKPLIHFGTPIELYIKSPDGNYLEWQSKSGHTGCRVQAWSAAVAFDLLSF